MSRFLLIFLLNGVYSIPNVVHCSQEASVYVQKQCCGTNSVDIQCSAHIRITKLTKPLTVGKQPFWDEKSRSVFFVDVPEGTVHRYFVDSRKHYYKNLGTKRVGNIIPIECQPNEYMIAHGDRIAILTWDGKKGGATVRDIRQPDPTRSYPDFFIDDMKVAPDEAVFFIYTPDINGAGDITAVPPDQCTLYDIKNKEQKTLVGGLKLADGLGFSEDGSCFFYCDSARNLTYKADYDQKNNSLNNIRVLLDYATLGIPGHPDSLTLDKEGYPWITCNGGNRIIKVDPKNGKVICSILLPAQRPTNLAFGESPYSRTGKLDSLYVTTQSNGIESPNAFDGTLILIQGLGTEGVLPYKVKIDEIL